MGTRPITDAERMNLEVCLKKAIERQQSLNNYIVRMEKELQDGTTWSHEPKAFIQMCKEVEENSGRWEMRREQKERQD